MDRIPFAPPQSQGDDVRRPLGVLGGQIDQARRGLGALLDALGWGPVETPSRAAFAAPVVTLKAYGEAGGAGPVVLLVPAPIKR
ncbi:MAG: hypothetical protein M3Q65_17300, partial [Chloroflexota bacterium]|nr:hypothetical protein [Chloroflexota bacterium]